MAARYWSVERDGDTVLATCPEPLRSSSDTRPEWMTGCAAAIRDELRLLEIREGTLLEATLTGEPPPGVGLENALLYNVGVPQAQLLAGVRVRVIASGDGGFVQRYRRAPIVAGEPGERLAAVVVPLPDGYEFERALDVWRAVRGSDGAGVLARAARAPGRPALRTRLFSGSVRMPPGIELVHRLLDGVRASLQDDTDATVAVAARRLDGRICAAEVVFVTGGTAQLEVELWGAAPAEV